MLTMNLIYIVVSTEDGTLRVETSEHEARRAFEECRAELSQPRHICLETWAPLGTQLPRSPGTYHIIAEECAGE